MADLTPADAAELRHLVAKARDAAAGGVNALSAGEALAAALVLNRPDWLAAMRYTIAEAIERIGPAWARLVPEAERQLAYDAAAATEASAALAHAAAWSALSASATGSEPLDVDATFVTHGTAPGYRDAYLSFDVRPTRPATASLCASICTCARRTEKPWCARCSTSTATRGIAPAGDRSTRNPTKHGPAGSTGRNEPP